MLFSCLTLCACKHLLWFLVMVAKLVAMLTSSPWFVPHEPAVSLQLFALNLLKEQSEKTTKVKSAQSCLVSQRSPIFSILVVGTIRRNCPSVCVGGMQVKPWDIQASFGNAVNGVSEKSTSLFRLHLILCTFPTSLERKLFMVPDIVAERSPVPLPVLKLCNLLRRVPISKHWDVSPITSFCQITLATLVWGEASVSSNHDSFFSSPPILDRQVLERKSS